MTTHVPPGGAVLNTQTVKADLFLNCVFKQMLAHKPIHSFELRTDNSRTSSFRQATAARKMPAADRLSDALDRLDLLGSW